MMHAWQLTEDKDEQKRYAVKLASVAEPDVAALPWPRSAVVKVLASALNHRDNWMTKGMYPGLRFDATMGADACGQVVSVADTSKDGHWVGKRVVINSALNWGDDTQRPGPEFYILGMPFDGTFASKVGVPVSSLCEAPAHLSHVQAAALPLGGLTAYRALVTKGRVAAGSTALITGCGGGVALLAVQLAVAIGANVFVTSGSDEKIERAIGLGALGGVNYKTKGWHKQLGAMLKERELELDTVVDGAGGNGLNSLIKAVRIGGVVVSYGATAGAPSPLALAPMFLKNVELKGSTMGSPEDFEGLMRVVDKAKMVPQVDSVFAFADFGAALERMREGGQFGKIVLDHSGEGGKSSL